MATMIFEQQTLSGFKFDADYGLFALNINPSPFELVLGKTYSIYWDGETYVCEPQDMSSIIDGAVDGSLVIGDLSSIGGQGNGEPFFIGWSQFGVSILASDEKTEHEIAIYQGEAEESNNDVVLKNYHGTPVTYEGVNYVALKKTDGSTATFVSEHLIMAQAQADWAQTDETAVDFIKNKPENELPASTVEDKGKLLTVGENGDPEWKVFKGNVKANWNQYDATEPDFIINKPFGDFPALIENKELSFEPYNHTDGGMVTITPIELKLGESYKVIFDGTEYIYECKDGLKDFSLYMYYVGDSSENPFFICTDYEYQGTIISTKQTGTTHTISIIPMSQIKKLDEKYIPNIFVKSVNGKTPDINGNVQISAGGDSGPTGTIEKEKKIEYTMTEVPSVSCDFIDGTTFYKISDTTFSKEELLLSEWTIQIPGEEVENATWFESDIMVNTEDILIATKGNFAIAMCYKSGEITIEKDVDLIATVNIPEIGLYLILDPAVIGYLLGTQMTAKATIIKEVNFVQSNWNQSDYTKPDYIKNKPFGDIEVSETLIDGSYNYVYTDNGWLPETVIPITSDVHLTEGNTYEVTFNGTKYICEAVSYVGIPVVGNTIFTGGEDNGVPFVIAEDETGTTLGAVGFMFAIIPEPDPTISTNVSYDIKLVYNGVSTKKIDAKYLYQPDWDENDISSGSYIANKPFGTLTPGTIAVDTSVTMMAEGGENAYFTAGFPIEKSNFVAGGIYNVTFNNEVYENCECRFDSSINAHTISSYYDDIQIIDSHPNIGNGMSIIFVLSETSLDGVTCDLKVVLAEDYIKKIDSKYLPDDIGGGGSNVQPDWNQNDNTQPDYIQNRPFYIKDVISEELVSKDNVVLAYAGKRGELSFYRSTVDITEEILNKWHSNWISVDIEWKNVIYNCTAKDLFGNKAAGNLAATIASTEDTGEPFCVFMNEHEGNLRCNIWTKEELSQESITRSMRLSINTEVINKIDAKYLPEEVCVPSSSTSDKDKILTVNSEGSAAWATPTKELPTITPDTDEGKFLRVVGGVATWSSIPSAEEAEF